MQLNLVEGFDMGSLGHNSAAALHVIAESIKIAKADMYHFVAYPETTDVPTAGLLSKMYADARRAEITRDNAMEFPHPGTPPGAPVARQRASVAASVPSDRSYPGSTTSFSVADRYGNVVVGTPTLGSEWGTGVVVGETGIVLNNGTRLGSTSPYSDDANYARGGQIPVLDNAPVIVMKDGVFFLALGTPGGETIGQTQFQVLLNIIDHDMDIQQAIEAPRIALDADPNFYRPGADVIVRVEDRIGSQVVADLEVMGHKVARMGAYSIGSMQGILVDSATGTRWAGADPRRTMYTIGW